MKKFITLWLVSLAFAACSNTSESPVNPDAPRPAFTVIESDEESSDNAWLSSEYSYSGTISAAGFAYISEGGKDYTDVPCPAGDWTQTGALLHLDGLKPDTKYRFYCYVIAGGQRYNSISQVFTTPASGETPSEPKPVFQTPGASNTTASSAVLACVYAYKGDKQVTETGFYYKKNDAASFTKAKAAATGSPITVTLSGLTAASAYTAYAYVSLDGREYNSGEMLFATTDPSGETAPTFGTPSSYAVQSTSTGVSCNFSYGDPTDLTEIGFRYKVASASSYTKLQLQGIASGEKSATLTGLSPATTYSFHLYAVVAGKTYQSTEATFTTQAQSGATEARYAGWAELPAETQKSGDYYYAYHMTDRNTSGGDKARNYGVCYSKELMCAIWVSAPMHPFYVQPGTNRTNAYKNDPKMSFTQPGKWDGYTRGHLLGSGERLVSRLTNEQVFYYSNIAPQLGQPYFNTGGGAWNTLEDWVDTQWTNSSDTTYQVIGCYWANRNKKVNGTTIPTHYYKVLLRTKGHKNKWVVNCSRDELQCMAVMVEHRTYSKNEVPKPSQYASKGMLMSVAQLEAKTGLKFFVNVPNAPKDVLNASDWGL